MSTPDLERVARALFENEWAGQVAPSDEWKQGKAYWVNSARAAVAALMEPSDEMLRAQLAVDKPGTYREYLRHPANGPASAKECEQEIATATKRLQAMLRAVLGDNG